jgi:membrane associated rhomboid family serine protease
MEITTTIIIIIITSLVSFTAFSNDKIMNDLIFYPPAVQRGQWYRFFSCGLLHADIGHLIFNMLSLYFFGRHVESHFEFLFGNYGKLVYLAMYILALGACLLPTYGKNKDNYHYRSLGASGGVSAVIFSSILFTPLNGIGLFFIPVGIAGFLFGLIYLVVSSMLDRKGGSNVNHSAHIYGALFGIAFTIIICRYVAHYPVLSYFVEQVKNARLEDLIQFSR